MQSGNRRLESPNHDAWFSFQQTWWTVYTAALLNCSADRDTVTDGSMHFSGRSTPSCQVSGSQNMQYNQHHLRAPCLLSVQATPPLWTIHASIDVVCLLSHRCCFCSVSSWLCAYSRPNTRGGVSCLCSLGVAYHIRCLCVHYKRDTVLVTFTFCSFPSLLPARVTCL